MNKKHKTIYIILISIIAIIVGSAIFVWLFIYDGVNPLSNTLKYETLINKRNSYTQQYENEENEYKHLKSDLDSTDDYKEKVIASELLVLKADELIEIQKEVVKIDDELLNLKLNDTLEKSILEASLANTDSLRTLEEFKIFLVDQDIVLRYYLELRSIENCFSAIDFNGETSVILSSLTTCHTYITNLEQIISEIETDIPMTSKYIKVLDEYWSSDIELYAEINAGRTNRLDELNESIKSKKKVVNSSSVESENEINEWLADEYTELE